MYKPPYTIGAPRAGAVMVPAVPSPALAPESSYPGVNAVCAAPVPVLSKLPVPKELLVAGVKVV